MCDDDIKYASYIKYQTFSPSHHRKFRARHTREQKTIRCVYTATAERVVFYRECTRVPRVRRNNDARTAVGGVVIFPRRVCVRVDRKKRTTTNNWTRPMANAGGVVTASFETCTTRPECDIPSVSHESCNNTRVFASHSQWSAHRATDGSRRLQCYGWAKRTRCGASAAAVSHCRCCCWCSRPWWRIPGTTWSSAENPRKTAPVTRAASRWMAGMGCLEARTGARDGPNRNGASGAASSPWRLLVTMTTAAAVVVVARCWRQRAPSTGTAWNRWCRRITKARRARSCTDRGRQWRWRTCAGGGPSPWCRTGRRCCCCSRGRRTCGSAHRCLTFRCRTKITGRRLASRSCRWRRTRFAAYCNKCSQRAWWRVRLWRRRARSSSKFDRPNRRLKSKVTFHCSGSDLTRDCGERG